MFLPDFLIIFRNLEDEVIVKVSSSPHKMGGYAKVSKSPAKDSIFRLHLEALL